MILFDRFRQICYNKLSASSVRKEVGYMEYILTFLISVAAGVVSYCICKWIDRR